MLRDYSVHQDFIPITANFDQSRRSSLLRNKYFYQSILSDTIMEPYRTTSGAHECLLSQ